MQPNKKTDMTDTCTSRRFPCNITLENITLSLSASTSGASCVEASYWDEMRVVVERDGVTMRTRWLSPSMAETTRHPPDMHTPQGYNNADVQDVSSAVAEVRWSSINAATFTVQFLHLDRALDHSLDPGYERPAYSANLKYLESYNTDAAGRNRAKVCPKTIHPFLFRVECRKMEKPHLSMNGEGGDKKPTSANLEAMYAYCARGKSLVSTIVKKAAAKISSEAREESQLNEKSSANSNSFRSRTQSRSGGFTEIYFCDRNGVDPSEAYNAPNGRKHISLPLYSSTSELTQKKAGVPLVLHLTMVAHINDQPVSPIRDYHSMVVLLDQVVVGVLNEQRQSSGKVGTNAKVVESYAFGFTSNTSRTNELSCRSPFVTLPPITPGDDEGVRVVDFASLHPSQNERELKASDLLKNPTSACIVSSGCKVGCKKRIGNRAVLVSRFKTALDGLCKPSYKCQLVMCLIRRYINGEVEEERCSQPVDLASILNQEYYPDRIRQMVFSHGERMSFRIRRRCFVDPERYRCELLMPYDYDNSGIDMGDLDNGEDMVSFLQEGQAKIPQDELDGRNCSYHGNDDDSTAAAASSATDRVEKARREHSVSDPSIMGAALTSYNNYEGSHGYHLPPLPVEEEEEEEKNDAKVREANADLHKEMSVMSQGSSTSGVCAEMKKEAYSFILPSNPFLLSSSSDSPTLTVCGATVGTKVTNPFMDTDTSDGNHVEETGRRCRSSPLISFLQNSEERMIDNTATSSLQKELWSFGESAT